jgi:hypothetical protein
LAALCALAGVSQLRDDLAGATVRWIAWSREIATVVARLGDAGVAVAPIKGLAYAAGLYPQPAARPMTDVDLLVQPGRVTAARDVLERAGFTLASDIPLHHASTWERGDLTVDLHRDIMPIGRGRIAHDELWARTRPGWPAGARRLDSVDELVFHLAHMARGRLCGPLVQVVDAARLLEHAGATQALERARQWKIGAPVSVALAFCRAIIDGTSLPWLAPADDDVLFARQPGVARKLLFELATSGSPRQLAARTLGAAFQRLPRLIR